MPLAGFKPAVPAVELFKKLPKQFPSRVRHGGRSHSDKKVTSLLCKAHDTWR